MITLVENSRANYVFNDIRDRHYVTNKGCIGRQIHYLIFDNQDFGSKPIGIISGTASVYRCKPRDDYFQINKNNRHQKIQQIINNGIFRLEKREKNLASHILKLWRKQILKDWYKKYKAEIIGFETFVFGENRTGSIYKADNWNYVGMSKGAALITTGKGDMWTQKRIRKQVEPKLIYCKKI